MSKIAALRELGLVCWAWIRGDGPAGELLLAWLEIATGTIAVDDKEHQAAVTV